jgi:hypothetical protein
MKPDGALQEFDVIHGQTKQLAWVQTKTRPRDDDGPVRG